MNAYDVIKNEIQGLVGEAISFTLETPADISHGDYATNITLVLSKARGVAPKALALEFAPVLEKSLKEKGIISKVEIAGPGFINFFLTDEKVRTENNEKEVTTKFSGKNILVEHSSLNLFKPFTIGHLVNNIIGEFISRATKQGGSTVTTMSYPSDVSLGIAKAVFIIHEDGGLEKGVATSGQDLVTYLGEAYRRGVLRYDEDDSSKAKMKEFSDDIYAKRESEAYIIYGQAKSENINYFLSTLNALGSNFDDIVFESEAGIIGLPIIRSNTGDNKTFVESEGAVVFIPDEERKDINTTVFINSEGHPTYAAKDIGLATIKFTKHNPDISFFITDGEQIPHFRVVLEALRKLGDPYSLYAEKSIHVPHGRMLFKGAKMSSRLGGVPLALDVIAAVEEEVREKSSDKIAHLSEEEKSKLVRDIALSALRIAVLRSKPGININFDPETSLSFEGDSGPYLMYTHARTSSLLDKGGVENPEFGNFPVTVLEREMFHYEEVLKDVIETLSPQKLVSYLFTIAQSFNSYYASTQVLVDGDVAGNSHRLAIVKRVKHILKDGLYVLGCNAPERM